MVQVLESFLIVGLPAAVVIIAGLVFAAREDRELKNTGKPAPRKKVLIPTLPDPDAHLGRVGTE